jgi:hypothetical protein
MRPIAFVDLSRISSAVKSSDGLVRVARGAEAAGGVGACRGVVGFAGADAAGFAGADAVGFAGADAVGFAGADFGADGFAVCGAVLPLVVGGVPDFGLAGAGGSGGDDAVVAGVGWGDSGGGVRAHPAAQIVSNKTIEMTRIS